MNNKRNIFLNNINYKQTTLFFKMQKFIRNVPFDWAIRVVMYVDNQKSLWLTMLCRNSFISAKCFQLLGKLSNCSPNPLSQHLFHMRFVRISVCVIKDYLPFVISNGFSWTSSKWIVKFDSGNFINKNFDPHLLPT